MNGEDPLLRHTHFVGTKTNVGDRDGISRYGDFGRSHPGACRVPAPGYLDAGIRIAGRRNNFLALYDNLVDDTLSIIVQPQPEGTATIAHDNMLSVSIMRDQ